jgi:hypothetical protein
MFDACSMFEWCCREQFIAVLLHPLLWVASERGRASKQQCVLYRSLMFSACSVCVCKCVCVCVCPQWYERHLLMYQLCAEKALWQDCSYFIMRLFHFIAGVS